MSFGPTEIIVIMVIIFLVWLAFRGLFTSNSSDEPGFSKQTNRKTTSPRKREPTVKPGIDWEALNDPQVQEALSRNSKIEAIKQYRLLTDQGLKESKDAIDYAVAHPEAVREKNKGELRSIQSSETPEINWDAVNSVKVRDAINRSQAIEAIKHYREMTGQGLKEAKDAIEYVMAHPDAKKKGVAYDSPDAGIRDLVREGNLDQAIKVYRQFAGVDEFTAKDAITRIQRELQPEDEPKPRPESDQRLYDLIASGNKIEAIKIYREMTGLGLKEAKDAVDEMERSRRL